MFEAFGLGADFVFNSNGTENIGNIVTKLNRLHSEMEAGKKKVTAYANTMDKFANAVTILGAALTGAGIAQTISTIDNVMQASSWQDAMIDASRYMSDTSIPAQTEYNQKLAETAKQFGKTKDEINAATISYMQMGKTTEDALRLVSNASFAATTWDMSADTISEAFRSIKSSWKVNMEDQATFDRYVDVINEVGNTTAATSAEIVSFLDQAGGALASVGKVQLDDAISMVAAARSANLNVNVFGTAMQTLMNRYSQEGAKYFKTLKINIKDGKDGLIPFNEAIEQAANNWDKYGESQKQAFLSGFGKYHASTLGKYIGAYSEQEKAKKITQSPERYDGSAQKEFERVTDTFNFALSQMRTTLDDFSNTIWQTLLPPFTQVIKIANKVITTISNFIQAHPAIAKTIAWASLLSGVLLIVGGSVLLVIGLMLKFSAGLMNNVNILSQCSSAIGGANSAIGGLKTALLQIMPSLKQGVLHFGKLAMVSGIMYLAWKYDFFNIKTMVQEFVSKLKISMNEMKHLLSADISINGLTNGLQKLDNSNSVIDRLTAGFTRLGYVIKGVSEGWNDFTLSDDLYHKLVETGLIDVVTQILLFKMRMEHFFKGIKEGFLVTRDAINELFVQYLGPVFNWVKENILFPILDLFPILKDGFVGVMQIINGEDGEKANQDFERLGMAVGSVIAVLFACKTAVTLFGIALSGVTMLFKVFGVFSTVISGIGTAFGFVAGIAKTVIGGILAGIGTVVTSILAACGIVVTLPAWVVGLIAAAVVALVVLIVTKKDEILAAIKALPGQIIGFVKGLPSKLGQIAGWIVGTVVKMLGKILPAIFNIGLSILNFVAKIPGYVLQFIKDLPGNIVNFFINLPENFVKIGKWIIEGLINGIKSMWSGIKDAVSEFCGGFIQGFKDALGIHSPSRVMFGIGDNTMQGFENGVVGKEDSINSTMTEIGSGVSEKFSTGLIGFDDAGKNSMSDFENGLLTGTDGLDNTLVGIGNSSTDALGLGLDGMDDLGFNTMTDFGTSLTNNKGIVTSATQDISSGVNDILNGSFTVGSTGSNVMDTLASNINNNKDTAMNDMSNLGVSMADTLGTGFSSADFSNSDLLGNFDSGITSSSSSSNKLMKDTGKGVIKSFQKGVKSGDMKHIAISVIKTFNTTISNRSANSKKVANVAGRQIVLSFMQSTKGIKLVGIKLINNFVVGMNGRKQFAIQNVTIIFSDIEKVIYKTIDKMPSMGSKMIKNFGNGIIDEQQTLKQTSVNVIQFGISDVFDKMNKKYSKWGANMVDGFVSGMNSKKKAVQKASSNITKDISDYMGFHSPSKKGEGRNIVIWGENMVKGFLEGVEHERSDVNNVMDNMLNSPNTVINTDMTTNVRTSIDSMPVIPDMNTAMNVVPNVDNKQIDEYMNKLSPTVDVSNSISAILESNPLEDILYEVKFIASVIGKNNINSNGVQDYIDVGSGVKLQNDVKLNTDYKDETQAKVEHIYNQIINNNRKIDLIIESGAIQNIFNINGNNDNINSDELIKLILSVIDDNFLPLLEKRIKELQIVGSE